MKDISNANFIKIELESPGQYHHASTMDMSRPCILILGGENTDTLYWAHNYCISIAKTLYLNGITRNLDIYSVYYKMRDRDCGLDRLNLFREFRTTNDLRKYCTDATLNDIACTNQSYQLNATFPNYIYDIFNFAFIPRIAGRNNQMLPDKKIKANLKNMLVYTHCHGTYVLRMIEKLLHQESNKFTYSLHDMYDLQKNLLTINHAPFAPLENCRFSAISFASASDIQINYYNQLSYHMRKTPDKFIPAFFGDDFGNLMITSRIKEDTTKEHSQVGLSGDPNGQHELTEAGKILFAVERNALLTGVRSMLQKKPIPEISKLVQTDDLCFAELQNRGQSICKRLDIRTR